MNTTLLPKSVVRSVALGILRGRRWSGPAIGNPCLRKHTRLLARMYRKENIWTRRLRGASERLFPLVELRTPLLTRVEKSTLNTVPVLLRIAEYEEQWIRPPETWEPDLQLAPRGLLLSLIRHLFQRYDIPAFCDGAWFINGPIRHIERDWFCHLAQGGNIRKFPGWVPPMTKRAASLFLQAPTYYSMRNAVRFGQVMAILGEDSQLAHQVVQSRIGLDFSSDAVYLPMIEKWAATDRSIWPEQDIWSFELVADYLWARCQLEKIDEIQLRSIPWEDLVRSALKFFRKIHSSLDEGPSSIVNYGSCESRDRLLRVLADSWEPMPEVRTFEKDSAGSFWKMVEITCQRELEEEGRDMSHCVSGYSGMCQRGDISIFSLRSRRAEEAMMDRDVTLEVWRKKRKLLQVKAWQNRRPHPSVRRVVMQWCKENQIDPGAYSLW